MMRKMKGKKKESKRTRGASRSFGPGQLITPSQILSLSDDAHVLVSTPVACGQLHSIRAGNDVGERLEVLVVVEKRIEATLHKRTRWEIGPARIEMKVSEIKTFFERVDGLPFSTFKMPSLNKGLLWRY